MPKDVDDAKTSVINIARERSYKDTGKLVFIGRPGKWGNPFRVGIDGTRAEVIERYRGWIETQPELMSSLHELRGKRLGCFCKPKACHGDVLVELLHGGE